MLLPMILGNLMLLADVIATLPLGLQLMFLVLAGVIAMLLYFLYGRWWCCCHLVDVCIRTCYCHLFLWLLVLTTFDHQLYQKVYHCCCCYFSYGRCYCHDGWQYCHVYDWQMLLPCGWCFYHCYIFLFCWQMLLPGGWCFCHYYVVLFCWQMLLPGGWWNAYYGCGLQML